MGLFYQQPIDVQLIGYQQRLHHIVYPTAVQQRGYQCSQRLRKLKLSFTLLTFLN